ncbi:MAG: response regulator [Candidatus Thermoplasmatota archaeon]
MNNLNHTFANGPARVLWAEDNAQDRMLIEESLDGKGASALTVVADGVHLLEALETKRPDLVVLDLKMPRLGGLEVLRRIRSHVDWQGLPVTIFSSGNRPDEIEHCKALGVNEIVQKPVDFDLFSMAVQRVVGSARPAPADGAPPALPNRAASR